jgi:replicative superfamily II helicase
MKFVLREFQKAHVGSLLTKLKQAKRDLLDDGVAQAITLSAPTASGKTVIMTALIERVLLGKVVWRTSTIPILIRSPMQSSFGYQTVHS